MKTLPKAACITSLVFNGFYQMVFANALRQPGGHKSWLSKLVLMKSDVTSKENEL